MNSETSSPPRDVFISYAREDVEFVKGLAHRLTAMGQTVWIDVDEIHPSSDWWDVILHNIQSSSAFAFVASRWSVVSKECERELEHAVKVGKKIIPVLKEETELPHALAKLQWISMRDSDELERGIDDFVRTLSFDLEWSQLHSRILVRAREWERYQREREDLLLRGRELEEAENGRDRVERNERWLTPLDLEFITASRRAVTLQLEAAARREKDSLSRQLAAQSEHLRGSHPDQSVLLALEAASVSSTLEARRAVFRRAVDTRSIYRFLHPKDPTVRVAISPSGSAIATGGGDSFLRRGNYVVTLWDSAEGRELRSFGRHASSVQFLEFTGDGGQLVSASYHEAVVWDATKGDVLAKLENPSAQGLGVGHVSCSMDAKGNRVATSFGHGFLVWDWRRGATWQVPWRGRGGNKVALHPNRAVLALVDLLGELAITLVDFEGGETLGELEVPSGLRVTDAAFAADGRTLLATACDKDHREKGNALLFFDVKTGGAPRLVQGQEKEVNSFAFVRGASRLLLAREDELVFWDVEQERQLETLAGHRKGVRIEAVAASRSGDLGVSCDDAGLLVIWLLGRTEDQESDGENPNAIHSVAFSMDGNNLATCDVQGKVRLFALRPVSPTHSFPGSRPTLGAGGMRECDRFQLELLTSKTIGAKRLCVASTSGRIFIGGRDGTLYELKWQDGRIGHCFSTGLSMITSIAASVDGKLVACGDAEGSVGIWEIATGRRCGGLGTLHSVVYDLHFHPTGSLLAIALGERNYAVLWDVAQARVAAKLEDTLLSGVAAVRFSPDGSRLLIGGAGIALSLWDVAGRSLIGRLPSIDDGVFSLEMSPDYGCVTVGTVEGAIALLDAATGRMVGKFETGGLVTSLSFRPEGDLLASASEEGSVRLWDAGVTGWGDSLRRRVNREFTDAERREFFGTLAEADETTLRSWSLWRGAMSLDEMTGRPDGLGEDTR